MSNHQEVADLMAAYQQMNDAFIKADAENARLRSALTQFVAACETAPPTSLMIEIGMACKVAKAALA